jgi:hypothetical protein
MIWSILQFVFTYLKIDPKEIAHFRLISKFLAFHFDLSQIAHIIAI